MKTLNSEEKDIRKWKDITYTWIVRIKIEKVTILPKVVYRLNESVNQNPHLIICRYRKKHNDNNKNYPKIHMEPQKTWTTTTIMSKKNNVGGIPELKIY